MLGPFGRDIHATSDDSEEKEGQAARPRHLNATLHRDRRKQRKSDAQLRSIANSAVKQVAPVGDAGYRRIHSILCRLNVLSGNQSGLNGYGPNSKNLWIVKPAAKSRGRGITTFSDLDKLLVYVDAAENGGGSGSGGASMWIVQKYMENPMTIGQYVLVDECVFVFYFFWSSVYIRFVYLDKISTMHIFLMTYYDFHFYYCCVFYFHSMFSQSKI